MPITGVMLIGYCVLFVFLPTALEVFARVRGVRLLAVMGLVAAEVVGVLVLGAGLLALAYHGYVEDFGEQPANTLRTALPLLAAGSLISLLPWLVVLSRRPR